MCSTKRDILLEMRGEPVLMGRLLDEDEIGIRGGLGPALVSPRGEHQAVPNRLFRRTPLRIQGHCFLFFEDALRQGPAGLSSAETSSAATFSAGASSAETSSAGLASSAGVS